MLLLVSTGEFYLCNREVLLGKANSVCKVPQSQQAHLEALLIIPRSNYEKEASPNDVQHAASFRSLNSGTHGRVWFDF